MRVVSVVLLSFAAFCLYLGASLSLAVLAIPWMEPHLTGPAIRVALAVVAVLGWLPFAIFLLGGLACVRWRQGGQRAAVAVLCGALLTAMTWITMGASMPSPGFDVMLPPGHDYPAAGRVLLCASLATLPLIGPIGWWLQRRSTAAAVTSPQR